MLFELAEPSVGGVARSERLLHLKLPSQFADNVEELEMNWCKSGCAGFKGRVAEKRGARGCGTSQSPPPPGWRLRDAEWADRPADFCVRIEHLPAAVLESTSPHRL